MRLRPFRALAHASLTAALICPVASAQSAKPLRDGDRVLIKLWMDSTFSDTARVQNGQVVLPRHGPVSILNVPLNLVADSLRRAYAGVFRSVVAEVTPLVRVTMSGELQRPSVYFVDPSTSARDAVAMAGGVTSIGKRSPVLLIRDGGTIRLAGSPSDSVFSTPLQSGDVLFVQRESWFKRNAPTLLSGISLLISVISLARP